MMCAKCNLVFVVFFAVCYESILGIKWLALHSSTSGGLLSWNKTSDCKAAKLYFGTGVQAQDQIRVCEESLSSMSHVVDAARLSIETCQGLFKNRRWNCSSIVNSTETPDLSTGTREQAMVYALSSAAILYSISRACASGISLHCGCASQPKGHKGQPSPRSLFKWGGCGDNTRYGVRFARKFTDRFEKRKYRAKNSVNYRHSRMLEEPSDWPRLQLLLDDATSDTSRAASDDRRAQLLSLINLHNNKIGRKVVTRSVETQCKCHGVSGSCNVKTCWRAAPNNFEQVIGQELFRRYTRSVEMPTTGEVTAKGKLNRRGGLNDQIMKLDHSQELVYIAKSPDYCIRDDKVGSLGTSGRECSPTATDSLSCDKMCCGRGYRSRVVERIERCHCKHVWCCYVKCKTCRTLVTFNTCV